MRLYRVEHQSDRLPREWWGTQDDAKRRAREIGGYWEIVEVPTDKLGLMGFLKAMEVRARPPAAAPVQPQPAAPKASPLATVTSDTQRQWDGENIAEFLLDRATVAQVENIFAAIGTRFAEARK
jgi:hypothetical protein